MAILDPANSAVDRIRLNIGDNSDMVWLTDDEIEYSLSYNNNNESAATKQCAGFILAKMAYNGHERLDKLEFWGAEVFNQYRVYLKDVLNNATYNATGGIFVAGMDLEDTRNNKLDSTIVQHKLPVYPYDDYSDPDKTVLGVYNDNVF